MTENVARLREWIASGAHRAHRRALDGAAWQAVSDAIQAPSLSLAERAALRLRLFLELEEVPVRADERIAGLRTITSFPDIYAPGERERLIAGHFVHEQGRVCNLASDYEGVLAKGLLGRRQAAQASLDSGRGDAEFLRAAMMTIDAVIAFADRYGAALAAAGQAEAGGALSRSIRTGALGFRDALQTFRILHFALWASNVYHNTVGRFDQYMWPYLRADMEKGILDEAGALALLEEFFLSFNRDSDLYPGMQQGDNGQSLMLGGCDAQGQDALNPLTQLCISASLSMRMIDPKINLRVNARTDPALFTRCTELTRQGLGFPQYANDDVVIPALIALGYAPEDARNYVVAACWEFIIPGIGMEIPNIDAISLAGVVDETIRAHLTDCATFEELKGAVREALRARALACSRAVMPLWIEPAPYQSVLMLGCLEAGQDISLGAKYNNYGIHGTGFASAVDQLAVIGAKVYGDGSVTKARMLSGLEAGFDGDQALINLLREEAPKLGRDPEAEPVADFLLDAFADALIGLRNERGGLYRAGTGSAMYYLWHADQLGCTADGRMAGEPLSANFSPSLLLRDAGPLSVIQAFARDGVRRVINGGPLTLELHDTVFKHPEGVEKVAQLVRSFIQLGGHQLQLNAVDPQLLRQAQADPEAYRHVIVRVWGWSGHFVNLDRAYQDQIIRRTSYGI